ncbi:uncharacterized protein EHS24_007643 [Apiotrichum porosum]|uniref:BZIP domain-containing protein n=1 Tax=Apiotrichum porosum TaxID=105984 RepID=A0A427XUY0_9TREE|nr:uncharacterized protein EHS24_007643 [Apiotrichum porosum]RSH82650.1 hypothetical protein EHS24_007643 [Apiotrichum porosum]
MLMTQFDIDDLAVAMLGTQKAFPNNAFSMPTTNLDPYTPPMLVRQQYPPNLNLGASHALVCGTETVAGLESLVTPFTGPFVPTHVYSYSPRLVTSTSMSPTTSTSSMGSCIDPSFLTVASLPPSPIHDPRSPIKTEHGDRLMLPQAERVPSSSSSVPSSLPDCKYWTCPPKGGDTDREQGPLATDHDEDGPKPYWLATPFGTPHITPPTTPPPLVKDSSPYTDPPPTPPTAQVVTPTKKRAATSLPKLSPNNKCTTTTPPTSPTPSITTNMAHYSAGVYYESEDELQDEDVSDYTPPPPKPTKATPTKRVRKAPTPSPPPPPARSSKSKSSAHTKASSSSATRPKPKSASWIARAGERRMAQNRSAQFKYRNKNKRLEELVSAEHMCLSLNSQRFEFSADVGSAVTQLNRGEITPSKAMQAISSACSRYEQDTASE